MAISINNNIGGINQKPICINNIQFKASVQPRFDELSLSPSTKPGKVSFNGAISNLFKPKIDNKVLQEINYWLTEYVNFIDQTVFVSNTNKELGENTIKFTPSKDKFIFEICFRTDDGKLRPSVKGKIDVKTRVIEFETPDMIKGSKKTIESTFNKVLENAIGFYELNCPPMPDDIIDYMYRSPSGKVWITEDVERRSMPEGKGYRALM